MLKQALFLVPLFDNPLWYDCFEHANSHEAFRGVGFGGLGSRDDAIVKATKPSYQILLYPQQSMTGHESERGRDTVSGTPNVLNMHPCIARIMLVAARLPSS